MKRLLLLVPSVPVRRTDPCPRRAAVKAKSSSTARGDTALSGWLVYNPAVKTKRAGVILIPRLDGRDRAPEVAGDPARGARLRRARRRRVRQSVRPTDAAGASAEAGILPGPRAVALRSA